jgi:hypothetical protein
LRRENVLIKGINEEVCQMAFSPKSTREILENFNSNFKISADNTTLDSVKMANIYLVAAVATTALAPPPLKQCTAGTVVYNNVRELQSTSSGCVVLVPLLV